MKRKGGEEKKGREGHTKRLFFIKKKVERCGRKEEREKEKGDKPQTCHSSTPKSSPKSSLKFFS
jgi:hypothetical protein